MNLLGCPSSWRFYKSSTILKNTFRDLKTSKIFKPSSLKSCKKRTRFWETQLPTCFFLVMGTFYEVPEPHFFLLGFFYFYPLSYFHFHVSFLLFDFFLWFCLWFLFFINKKHRLSKFCSELQNISCFSKFIHFRKSVHVFEENLQNFEKNSYLLISVQNIQKMFISRFCPDINFVHTYK